MSDWERVMLGEVADEVTVGFVGTMAAEYRVDGIPFLRSQNVKSHSLDLSDVKYIGPDFHAKLRKSQLHPGDVVTVRTGKPGTTAVIPPNAPEMNCADLVIIRPGSRIDSRWLSYYLNSAAAGFINSNLVGAVQQHFNVRAAKSIELSLPPLSSQRAIASALGSLDDLISIKNRIAKAAQEIARLLYLTATSGRATTAMGKVLDPVLGGTPDRTNSEYWTGRNLWASARDLTSAPHGVILDTLEKISDDAVSRTRARPLPAGSVLISARGTVGVVARLAEPSSFNQSCYGFLPDHLPPAVLYHTILNAVQQAKAIAHGSVFSTITTSTFNYLEIPEIDPEAAARIESDLEPFLDLVTHCVLTERALRELRDVLLPGLISGRLRVKDAEKEVEAVV